MNKEEKLRELKCGDCLVWGNRIEDIAFVKRSYERSGFLQHEKVMEEYIGLKDDQTRLSNLRNNDCSKECICIQDRPNS